MSSPNLRGKREAACVDAGLNGNRRSVVVASKTLRINDTDSIEGYTCIENHVQREWGCYKV